MNKIFKDICENGTYYYPAASHYEVSGLECNGVTCDRCHKDFLEVCIGKDDSDLCLRCVHDIVNINKRIKMFKPSGHMLMTRMEQSIYTPKTRKSTVNDDDPEVATFMMQDMFNYEKFYANLYNGNQ